MGIIKNIKNYFKEKIINKRIKQYKYVHIMFNDKFNKPFVDFLNQNFNKEDHLVLCKRWFKEFPFPLGENVIEIQTLRGLNFEKCEKVICHSLFDNELVDYLYKNKNILKEKSYWMIFGGDLYDAPRDKKNDFVRENFKGYLTKFDGDFLAKQYPIINKNYYDVNYIFPINLEYLEEQTIPKNNCIKIQINNSCDYSTLEILDVLSKFRDENIVIKTILSYGTLEYKDAIIKKGNEIFGNKFEYLDKILTPQEYVKYLAENNILILNQNRQQGIGNVISSLYLGKKCFIKKDVSTNIKLNKIGIHIYDTETISDIDFQTFIEYLDKINNSKRVKNLIEENEIKNDWLKFFKSINIDDIELFNLKKATKKMQEKILYWRNSEKVSCNFQIKYIDKKTHLNWLKSLYEKDPKTIAFLIKFKPVPKFIGLTYFRNINITSKSADFGIYIYDTEYRGRSIGDIVLKKMLHFAMKELDLSSINLEVLSQNKNAIKLYEKNGFKFIDEKNNVKQYKLWRN